MVRRKKPSAPEEVKIAYKIQFTDSHLKSRDLFETDFERFRQEFPQLAEIILNPELLYTNPTVQAKVSQENWQSAAMQLMNAVWKIKNANIFHYPVDPVKLNILDYFTIIKHPMDFGTIKVG